MPAMSHHHHRRRGLVVAICLIAAGVAAAQDAPGGDLARNRAARRAQVKAASLRMDKADGGAPFGLLVIPVDFADARLEPGWTPATEVGPRLTGLAGETLQNYFHVASGGRMDLRITLAPLVRLDGTRRDYSDVGLNGFHATRRLATESLTAVRDLGVPLRLLDMDGPDGVPGSEDDDGWVDGVLILHAAPGQENGGIVQPLQFFLEEPVTADGVTASSYAVASLTSGLGIWAHETGHLFGLEERYDPLIPSNEGDSELHSRGGLGRFSLMAAGAWGTGGGHAPALPDAYSAWQLGWCDLEDLPPSGTVADTLGAWVTGRRAVRVWTHGTPGAEFFLLEVRDPAAAAPFDAAVPGGSLLIQHVDESVPDGDRVLDGPGEYHLRTHVVEADGDNALRRGADEGGEQDLYPGTVGAVAFTAGTSPSSHGYSGPSAVSLTGIAPTADGVAYTVAANDGPAFATSLGFTADAQPQLVFTVRETGQPVAELSANVRALAPTYGSFSGGVTEVALTLVRGEDGAWAPDDQVVWIPQAILPAGAATRFAVELASPGWAGEFFLRDWHWDANARALDFAALWPGDWTIDHPQGTVTTTWHRWDGTGVPTADGAPVLACTGSAFTTPADWPDVNYYPGAHTTLTSAPLGADVAGVRLVHAWDAETLPTGEAMDGGRVEWVGPDGAVHVVAPVDGWPVVHANDTNSPLHGQGGFSGAMDLDAENRPRWRTDVVPVPADGPGPWQLRLVFGSNALRSFQRGWLVASLEPLAGPLPGSALPLAWDGDVLAWEWPDVAPPPLPFAVERRDGEFWTILFEGNLMPLGSGRYALSAEVLVPLLPGLARERHELRVLGPGGPGSLLSRGVVVYPDGGEGTSPFVGAPWPNPAPGAVRFLLEVPAGQRATLRVFSLDGREVRSYVYPPGSHLAVWDGTDGHGRRVASGTYIVRVDGPGEGRGQKVVMLR